MNGSTTIKTLSLILLLSICPAQAFSGMGYVTSAWNAVPSKSELATHANTAWELVPSKDVVMQGAYNKADIVAANARLGASYATEYATEYGQAITHNATIVSAAVAGHMNKASDAVVSAANNSFNAIRAHAMPFADKARAGLNNAFEVVQAHPYIAAATVAGSAAILGSYMYYLKNKVVDVPNASSIADSSAASSAASSSIDEELMEQARKKVWSRCEDFSGMTPEQINIYLDNEVNYEYAQLLGEDAEKEFLANCLNTVLAVQAQSKASANNA